LFHRQHLKPPMNEIPSIAICQALARRKRLSLRAFANPWQKPAFFAKRWQTTARVFAKIRQNRELFAGGWQFFGGIAVAVFLVWFVFAGYWRACAWAFRFFGLMD
jgi:hypothetical protein